ncbi:MAG: GNAT family N-acetyltransferase [Streptosporangiales bacterium]|nr:GNAT family N-acetyltransferase [Streptosporangiales bacterium]
MNNHASPVFVVRSARRAEHETVGELTVEAYVADGLLTKDSTYVHELRDAAARARHAELLVAADGERVLGTVTYCPGGTRYAELAVSGEADFRMLAVAPRARGRGVGEALVRDCVDRAVRTACPVLRLSTLPTMRAAHRLYERLGFRRTPERDWSPVPSITLLAYALDLVTAVPTEGEDVRYCDHCGCTLTEADHAACRRARLMEPPRYCSYCRRRMAVQVTPHGWTARCAEHGIRTR